jgi:hypothetical protein
MQINGVGLAHAQKRHRAIAYYPRCHAVAANPERWSEKFCFSGLKKMRVHVQCFKIDLESYFGLDGKQRPLFG